MGGRVTAIASAGRGSTAVTVYPGQAACSVRSRDPGQAFASVRSRRDGLPSCLVRFPRKTRKNRYFLLLLRDA